MKMKAMITGTIILLLVLAGCGSKNTEQQAAAEKELDRVTVANWSQPISEQTNLLVSEEKDFFKNQGLSVELIPGAGGGTQSRILFQESRYCLHRSRIAIFRLKSRGEIKGHLQYLSTKHIQCCFIKREQYHKT